MMAFTASISMAACTGGKDLPVTQDPLQMTEESYQEDLTEAVQEELTTTMPAVINACVKPNALCLF